MDGSRVSDFSIERILSPQLGHKPPGTDISPDGYLQGLPGGFYLDSGNRPPVPPAPVPVPVPMPGYLQYRGLRCGEAFYPYGTGFHHTDCTCMYSNSGVYQHFSSQDSADAQSLAGYHGYHQAGASAQSRQKTRMRTVFTDSQTRQLEALFELTDYPAVQARAEVARSTGLSEEIVRVWFKNRRARRKRQCGESKVRSPSPPRSAGAENKVFTSFI
ncbi:dharma [Micropterus dolomieu]|uniref:dharma n=1 Tax=Micropterus dolomieu TaxID=147949 RepID=UPI001E8EB159|nr:dharma [Micropterus dolomieu]